MFFSLSIGKVQHILTFSYSQEKKFIVNDMPLTFESNFALQELYSTRTLLYYLFLWVIEIVKLPLKN